MRAGLKKPSNRRRGGASGHHKIVGNGPLGRRYLLRSAYRLTMRRRSIPGLLVVLLVALAVAVPVLAAPGGGQGRGPKADKAPKVEVSVTGTVESTTDADGRTTYTLDAGGTTWTLHAGPSWFFDEHPLARFVGDDVTITGEHAEGSTDLDVLTVDGTTLREAGKPPWAGGWKRVGQRHPGWSAEKHERFQSRFGDCFPPGRCKDKNRVPAPTAAP